MQAVLRVSGWLLLLQGVGGLLNTLLGWWQWARALLVVDLLPVLKGYEVFAAIVMGVLGFALLAVAESLERAEDGE
ncbi:hypothetical protein BKM31_28920 [[Actinomadura] parvosata subsp. kistnae]|uniref:Uncharacterized protein n=2 Tax=Nonomuraea TaxID=83681 RepID=A0A1V0AKN1_9ACTN|nr:MULTISPECIES: hypothetical protein [unclassified Nonomuraea]AQZ70753.1 hypothetical protein BKM31_28920 [Nonomuraea sp. ATCC 55076]NJP90711.1 hypothetical protein [Nonomuraea sp. FMUSA5-5]